ncbi:transposase, partial [Halorubrum ezzemoulense]|nr:transposase [Halorubrum ezzemoulense]
KLLSRGSKKRLGSGRSESTPVENALPVSSVVDAKRVVETGSPTLKREGVRPSGRVG